jgi:small subunit ribosomal protein S13
MPRLVGVDLPENKALFIALQQIYGVGKTRANKVIKKAKLEPHRIVKDLKPAEISELTAALSGLILEGDLKKMIRDNIMRLKSTGSYRGMRHNMGLPVRGQNTRSNARSRKGRRKTVGSMTKEMRAKMDTPAPAAAAK